MSGSEATDFLRQIGGLLAVTCVAGVIWIGLLALVVQRASERRRRKQLGLDPLPGFYVPLVEWFKRKTNPDAAPKPTASDQAASRLRAQSVRASAAAAAMPMPDLAMLTGDLGEAGFEEAASYPEPALDQIVSRGEMDKTDRTPRPVDDEGAPPIEEEERVYRADFDLPPGEPPPDSIELLRVFRDLSDGSLIVEIGGQQFESLGDLRDANLERRFLNVVRDLDDLARRPAASRPRPPAEKRQAERRPPADRPKPADRLPSEPEPPAEASAAPSEPVSLSPGTMFRQMARVAMGQGPELTEREPELSIAEQIEQILQDRMAEMPDYQGREIHVGPSLAGGVRIEVDGIIYDSVGEVEDDEVRALLQDVVREWEESQ